MNIRFPILLAVISASLHAQIATPPPLPETEIPRDVAAKIKAITCNELESHQSELIGQIVKIKFTYRDVRIEDEKDDTCSGELQSFVESHRRTVESGWAMVKAIFPKGATPWFSKIPVNTDGKAILTAIGRVEKADNDPRAHIVLIGREIKTDLKGARAIW